MLLHALNVRFTTNRMCTKNNTDIYVARTSNNRVVAAVVTDNPDSYPGHSTILLRSESPSGMCAKLHTVVAASNNRSCTAITLRVR